MGAEVLTPVVDAVNLVALLGGGTDTETATGVAVTESADKLVATTVAPVALVSLLKSAVNVMDDPAVASAVAPFKVKSPSDTAHCDAAETEVTLKVTVLEPAPPPA